MTVPSDKFCIRCGYTLFGLSPEGNCPECGTPVERSLRGDLLEYCGEEYLAALHKGTFWIQTSIIIMVVSKVLFEIADLLVRGNLMMTAARNASAAASTGPPTAATTNAVNTALSNAMSGASTGIGSLIQTLSLGAELLTGMMSIYGWWLLSTADPGQLSNNKGDKPRRLIRVAMIVTGVGALFQFVLSVLHFPNLWVMLVGIGDHLSNAQRLADPDLIIALLAISVRVFAFVAWCVAFFAAMIYIRWLAPRVPSVKIFQSAGRLRWLGPLLYVLLGLPCCFSIGPLVAIILYYILLDNLRVVLKAIRAKVAIAPEIASP